MNDGEERSVRQKTKIEKGRPSRKGETEGTRSRKENKMGEGIERRRMEDVSEDEVGNGRNKKRKGV